MTSLLAFLLACTPDQSSPVDSGTPTVEATCDATGGRLFWALNSLAFVRVADDGTSDGFDLDQDVTEAGDSGGCGIPDMSSPAGAEGIDNAFARLLPVLETTEFVSIEGIFEALIQTGALMLIAEVDGAESLVDDACVTLAMRQGQGTPMLDTNGGILADQTVELADEDPAVATGVPIVGGSVQGGPFEIVLPVVFLDADVDLPVHSVKVRYDIAADGTLSGVFAGGIETAWVLDLVANTGISDELGKLLASVLGGAADLAPDDDGDCTQISATLQFTAVPVFVYPDELD